MRHNNSPLLVGILATPGVQMLDAAGPADVFAEANLQAGRSAYEIRIIATAPGPIVCSSGLRLLPDLVLGARMPKFHTLLVAGAPHFGEIQPRQDILNWLRAESLRAARFGSVCSGALLLAAAGLLEGRRVTTHWAIAPLLAERYPAVELVIDALHVRDGKLRTAAGVTAGLDLALALVEEDLGQGIAKQVASQLVMFFKRPGGQLQFSRKGAANPSGRAALQEVQRFVIAHPAEEAGLAVLASRAGLSPRHFARLFQQELGQTPAAWVAGVRLEQARQRLEAGERPKQVAAACGFGDIDSFRRAFMRQLGVSPAEYRRRFEAAAL